MKPNPTRKNKINLEDYDYKRDIENRILMSQFSVLDVEVLEEILHSSLTIHLSALASNLGRDMIEVMAVVDKLSQTGLCKRVGEVITVDKEMRKYYEFQILKFDGEFEPDMSFLASLLRKLPIHALPLWYAVPRSSTNIFQSILDKYLRTPKAYQRYLLELNFEDPLLEKIHHDVFNAPDFFIRSRELRDKYGLSRQEFQEKMLYLEFSFTCCVSYVQIEDEWKEVITPFYEWREYLRFLEKVQPKPIEAAVEERFPNEFTFIEALREAVASKGLPADKELADWVAAKMEQLNLGEDWLELDTEDKAISIYRHPSNILISDTLPSAYLTEKNFREVEKAISRIGDEGWIDFDEFAQGLTVVLHTNEEIALQKKSGHWTYQIPSYSGEDKRFVKAAIFERFVEAGYVTTGKHEGRDAFRITPFGRRMLSLA